jgi:hypothetical protein
MNVTARPAAAIVFALVALGSPAWAAYLITTPDSLMENQADYLVITHDNFTSSVLPLCRLRDSLGMEVKVAQVSLVYATFDSGPRADRIKAFLQTVYDNWSPRPEFVLLVGDASRDTAAGDFVPCKRFPKFSYAYAGGLTDHAIDNWYAQLAGPDSIPDIVVGRLPVKTAAGAESLVAKIVTYEVLPDTGLWARTVMLDVSTDRAGYADELESLFLRPAGDSVYKVLESEGSSAFLRHKTLVGFNQGTVLVCHVAHGTQPPAWNGSRTLFSYQDVESLSNTAALPVVLDRG